MGVEKGAGGAAGGYELVEDEEALKVSHAVPNWSWVGVWASD